MTYLRFCSLFPCGLLCVDITEGASTIRSGKHFVKTGILFTSVYPLSIVPVLSETPCPFCDIT